MKANDVLANEVIINGPMLVEVGVIGSVTNCCDVVRESIEPHICDVLVVPRQRNAPRETRAADTEIKKTLFDKANDFIHAVVGNNAVGMIGIPLQ